MRELVIIGAGAIGRGYLPWIFEENDYEFIFIDSNRSIVDQMKGAGRYATYRVNNRGLEKREVRVKAAYLPSEFDARNHSSAAAVFINVGPRNAGAAARLVESLDCPIILSENDPATVDTVKAMTSLRKVFFAVPDVITSNTAPPHLLREDSLSIVTEAGIMFVDERIEGLVGDFRRCSPAELSKQWTAKLYLHNTPHCVAAYLGALVGVSYVHEAMAIPEINAIVTGAMTEMLNSLKLKWDIPHDFLDWYAEKELARFSCELLFDPISRVAREPLRKLELEGRLIGAAQICLALGIVPENILIGIASALLFDNKNDSDRHLAFMRRALTPSALLTHVLSLRKGEALERVLSDRLGLIIAQLEELSRARKVRYDH
jgi:mannitol-1-phosphate 5-dehydrogenase